MKRFQRQDHVICGFTCAGTCATNRLIAHALGLVLTSTYESACANMRDFRELRTRTYARPRTRPHALCNQKLRACSRRLRRLEHGIDSFGGCR